MKKKKKVEPLEAVEQTARATTSIWEHAYISQPRFLGQNYRSHSALQTLS